MELKTASNEGHITRPGIRKDSKDMDDEAVQPLDPSGSLSPRSDKSSPRPSSTTVEMKELPHSSELDSNQAKDKPRSKSGLATIGLVIASCIAGCGFCGVLGLAICYILFPIATIVVGVLHFDRMEFCPTENLGRLLVTGGCIILAQSLLESGVRLIRRRTGDSTACSHILVRFTNGVLRFAILVWWLVAIVTVYRMYPGVSFERGTGGNYCHPTLYKFSFWLVTIMLVLVGLGLLLICGGFVCMIIARLKHPRT